MNIAHTIYPAPDGDSIAGSPPSSPSILTLPVSDLSCRICATGTPDALSPSVIACRSPGLSAACDALLTVEVESLPLFSHPATPVKPRGVPAYVMLPLDTVRVGGVVNRKKAMAASQAALKSAGVEGVMVDVWWGIVERGRPGDYDWGKHAELLEMARKVVLKVQAANVGDSSSASRAQAPAARNERGRGRWRISRGGRWGGRGPQCGDGGGEEFGEGLF